MKKMAMLLAGAVVAGIASVAAFAEDIKSGIQPGDRLSAFQVVDANTEKNKGKQLCYV
jgi:hypothetical protein